MSVEFVVASIVVVLVPGTGVVYTVTTSLNDGVVRGVVAAVGCTLGIVPHLVAASLLVSGVLDAVPGFVDSMRWVGAAYLAWLGLQLIRHGAFTTPDHDGEDHSRSSALTTAVRGVLLNVLNPKLLLFFLAFLPQFVGADAGLFDGTLLVLSGTFMLMTFVVFCGYAAAASMLAESVLRSDRAGRLVTKGLGSAMVLLGLQLAVAA